MTDELAARLDAMAAELATLCGNHASFALVVEGHDDQSHYVVFRVGGTEAECHQVVPEIRETMEDIEADEFEADESDEDDEPEDPRFAELRSKTPRTLN